MTTQPFIEDAEELYQHAPSGYLTMQADGLIVNINTTLLEWLGYKRSDIVLQKSFQDFLGMGEKIFFETHMMPMLQMQGEISEINIELRRKESTKLPTLINARRVANLSGVQPVYRFSVLNITQRKQYEVELMKARKTAEQSVQRLNQINKELEQFAYVASHDLKEPLRMVNAFMQKLQKEYATQLDDKAKKYIHFALDGSKRMTALINELLVYAKTGSDDAQKELTDFNVIINEVLQMQEAVLADKGATVSVDPMPEITVLKTAVKVLFQNLISNAIKYMPEGVKPRVNISVAEKTDNWEFAVADNGIGIKPTSHKEIFKLFKRLHTKEAYAGIGMGLATCEKIVNRHAGHIWVESEEGKGSTFYFTIPKVMVI